MLLKENIGNTFFFIQIVFDLILIENDHMFIQGLNNVF